MRFRGS
jgi:hypothetical protein